MRKILPFVRGELFCQNKFCHASLSKGDVKFCISCRYMGRRAFVRGMLLAGFICGVGKFLYSLIK